VNALLRKKSAASLDGVFPLDAAFLENQVPDLIGTDQHVVHYVERGLGDCLDPTPFFCTDWYAWQNPDWSRQFASPYLHYLNVGRFEGRDPSPFVDATRYHDVMGDVISKKDVYGAILSGLRAPMLGVYEGVDDLRKCQNEFMSGLALLAHRATPPSVTRPALVVCQAGRSKMIDNWAHSTDREWDLFMNYYDATGLRPGLGDYAVFQKGTKFSAMKLLLDMFPQLFAAYEHILFLDDDIGTTAQELNALFAMCRREALDLAQMSLTPGSACNWPHLFSRKGANGPRKVSAVEIMMPVFSRRALRWIVPTLGQSISGFGLDLVWGQLVGERQGRIAVIDGISATHSRGVDQVAGAYYSYLRRHGINAKAELWTLLKAYGASRDMVTV
jgi:hypothetical protein